MRKRREAVTSEPEVAARAAEPQAYVNAVWQGNKVALLWRDEQGELCKREVPAAHACHLRKEDFTPELERVVRSFRGIRGFKLEGDWVRLNFVDRDTCRLICGQGGYFEKHQIPTFEADLHPVRRWFAENPQIGIQKPRRGYLDLETDSRVPFTEKENGRILLWALKNHETGECFQGILEEDSDEAEIELLADLWHQLLDVDQVAVWAGGVQGGGMFDTDVLFARTKRYIDKLRVFPSRWLWISHLEAYKKMNNSAAGSGEEKQSMGLHAVAQSLGLAGKDDFDASRTWEAWLEGGEELARLARYNRRDVECMYEIERAKPYLDMLVSVCQACGTFPDQRGINGTSFVESFILRLAQPRGMHFRSHWRYESSDQFEGAFVLPPKRLGVMRNVHVCDFASLYPSIIQSWNLSIETHAPEHKQFKAAPQPTYLAHVAPKEQPIPAGHCRAPNTGECFRTDVEGILAYAVTELRRLRVYYTKKQAEYPKGTPEHEYYKNLSDGCKICVNTFYGVIGSPFSRFFKREVAESTSTTGAWLIKHVMREAEARGWELQSGDTDSAFVTGCTQQEFQEFVRWLNEVRIPELIKPLGCVRNEISLEAEKGFDVLVYTAKKRYCNPPEAPIWTGQSFKQLGDIQVGDQVVGWVSGTKGDGKRRQLKMAEVVAVHRHRAPIVKVTMASGRVLRCTADHRWLRFQRTKQNQWTVPKRGMHVVHAVDVPRALNEQEREAAAWLGGIFDGEGSLANHNRDQILICQSRKANPEVCDRIEASFKLLGLEYSIYKSTAPGCVNYAVRGGRQSKINFLAWCKPAKAGRFPKAPLGSNFGHKDRIVSVEPDGEGEVIGLTTTTGNYFAWGYASKNCGRFAYYKGKPATPDSKPEIKGLEYKRGDAVRLARAMQLEVVERLICKGTFPVPAELPYTAQDFVTIVERWRDRVLKEPLELEDYVKTQSLSADLKSYKVKQKKDGSDAAQPIHVEVAKRMKAQGMNVSEGTRIAYVVVDGEASPMKAVGLHEYEPGTEDRHYIWESQVWPPTFRVLAACFPEVDWKRYNRTRPYKGRAPKHGGAGEGQLGMLGAENVPLAKKTTTPEPETVQRGARVVG